MGFDKKLFNLNKNNVQAFKVKKKIIKFVIINNMYYVDKKNSFKLTNLIR